MTGQRGADHSRAEATRASVVIPAHDEEDALPGLLRAIDDPVLDVVVVCNGCTDRTADVARSTRPDITVLETPEPSKVGALRLGDDAATVFPRFYLDADIRIAAHDLRALARRLQQPGLLAVAPSVEFDVSGSSFVVRAYYRVLPLLPTVARSIAGTGCIGLSAEGRARFDDWPQVFADDYFLDSLFTDEQKERTPGVTALVGTPLRAGDLVRRRMRVLWGNRQVRAVLPEPPQPRRARGIWSVLRQHPRRLPDVLVYLGVGVWVRVALKVVRLRGGEVGWNRDQSRARDR